MGTTPSEFQSVAEAIERDGWYVGDGLLDPALVDALADECRDLDATRAPQARLGRPRQQTPPGRRRAQ